MFPTSSPLRTSPVFPQQVTPMTNDASSEAFSSPPLSSPTPAHFYFQGKTIKPERTPTRPGGIGGISTSGTSGMGGRGYLPLSRSSGSFDSHRYHQGSGSSAGSFAARFAQSQAHAQGPGQGNNRSENPSNTTGMKTTGFSLKPPSFDVSSGRSSSGRSSTHSLPPRLNRRSSGGNTNLPALPSLSLMDSAEKESAMSLQGAMWNQKFKQRVQDKSKRREEMARRRRQRREMVRNGDEFGHGVGGDEDEEKGGDGEEGGESDGDDEDEEIFRRMMIQEARKRRHAALVSYEREVGGSDPAIWEAELALAEAEPEAEMEMAGFVDRRFPYDEHRRYDAEYDHVPRQATVPISASATAQTQSQSQLRTQRPLNTPERYSRRESSAMAPREPIDEDELERFVLQEQLEEAQMMEYLMGRQAEAEAEAETEEELPTQARDREHGQGRTCLGAQIGTGTDMIDGMDMAMDLEGLTWDDFPTVDSEAGLSDESQHGSGWGSRSRSRSDESERVGGGAEGGGGDIDMS